MAAERQASTKSSVRMPGPCTISPPKNGPMEAPSGKPALAMPTARPSRLRGVTSASSASMTPVLPKTKPPSSRATASTQTLGLSAATVKSTPSM